VVKRRKNKTANHATQAIIDAQEANLARVKTEIAERLARLAPKLCELRERWKRQQEDFQRDHSAFERYFARATRVEMGLDPVPRKKKRQPAPVGAPPVYNVPAILEVAEDVAARGVPDKAAWFYEKLRTELRKRHIKQPGDTRLKELAGPVYKRATRARRI
jgi:hypothetical protein